MGRFVVEIESLLRQLDEVTAFAHSEALMPVMRGTRQRRRGGGDRLPRRPLGEPREEFEAQMAMARARVTLHDAQIAVRRAREAVDRDPRGLRARAAR